MVRAPQWIAPADVAVVWDAVADVGLLPGARTVVTDECRGGLDAADCALEVLMSTPAPAPAPGAVVELFAGVGGFRLGLEGLPSDPAHRERWQVAWSNQWEPSTKSQAASDCYVHRFGDDGHVCEDIAAYLDWAIDGDEDAIPEESRVAVPDQVDLLVGGFPCQDYSVAKPLSQATGIAGRKGVLWWEINRFLEWKLPRYVLLENVDRLLKSPSIQRGRDFAVMLSCFHRLGYSVQWRVVNAADYGFPQRRRRVFVLAERDTSVEIDEEVAGEIIAKTGTLARALPVSSTPASLVRRELSSEPFDVSETFGVGDRRSVWDNAGVMSRGVVFSGPVDADYDGPRETLGDVLEPEERVPGEFFIPDARVDEWRYLKGAKREPRVDKRTGHEYFYTEGGLAFPEPLDRPSRTILTGEGGTSPSRFKHVVQGDSGRLRRLVPVELERLQGFPDNWTEKCGDDRPTGDGRRAFFMGNALVVGLVKLLGDELALDVQSQRDTLLGG